MEARLKTPLRYPGGKSKATNKLLPYFPDLRNFKEYREPFLGGGSVAIAVAKINPDMNFWVNDLYWPLYNFWKYLRDRGDEMSDALVETKTNYNTEDTARELFNKAKKELHDKETTDFEKAINFWIVNKCSFSGLTESSTFSAQASVCNFSLQGAKNLREYGKLIKNWKITNQSYETLLTDADDDTFIYLDPPYEIKSNLYGKKGAMHKGFDHDLFAERCHLNGPMMAISYNADQSVMDRFPDWKQKEFALTYSMNNNSANYRKNQQKRNELILANYG